MSSLTIQTDSFSYNSYNNHGVIGLINTPSARFYNESVYGITAYAGDPDNKITLTSSPYDWLEASFFYTSLDDSEICREADQQIFCQTYKDKGFNFKLRLKEEGKLPAIALGINDLGGTGLYRSEYLVASYGINNIDFHFGIGWGNMNGSDLSFKNPFRYLSSRFDKRGEGFGSAGALNTSSLFAGQDASPFFGISYAPNNRLLLKVENDPTRVSDNIITDIVGYDLRKENDFSFGIDYKITKNFSVGISNERGGFTSFRFIYKNDPKIDKPSYRYKKAITKPDDDKYKKFLKNLRENGLGVNKILETSSSIGLELTQFVHPNLDIVEEIIYAAASDSGIDKEIKTDLKIVDLDVISQIDQNFSSEAKTIYERKRSSNFSSTNNIVFRPFLASREEFFKGALLIENNSEFVIRDNLLFSSNLKYSIADNFDDLILGPIDTYPAQVRSDIKNYLKNFSERVIIGRAQLDYYLTPKKNNHVMFTAGILEEMFSGAGFEYLYFNPEKSYALGFEVFDVVKRDYDLRFNNMDYKNVVGSVNFYYRNYNFIPFDMELTYGEYLAGDEGVTIDLSRSFPNGTKFGVFASFTDVSSEQFGEGSFDKGIYFNIPVFGNSINYSWRPLTKDPGAKLIRKNTLHDLLIKFRPIN